MILKMNRKLTDKVKEVGIEDVLSFMVKVVRIDSLGLRDTWKRASEMEASDIGCFVDIKEHSCMMLAEHLTNNAQVDYLLYCGRC